MKQLIHNLIILDESGSMSNIANQVITGFNETIQNIKGIQQQFTEQEHLVTVLTFNSLAMRTHLLEEKVELLNPIDPQNYVPNATTPLYDAMGYAITRLKNSLATKKNYNVLVTIFTDGEENASREFSSKHIRNLIEELSKQGWTFTYIGTDHNVEQFADNLSISAFMQFNKSNESMQELFAEEKRSRYEHMANISKKEFSTKASYFNKENKKHLK